MTPTRTWLWLIALSAGSTLASLLTPGTALTLAILALALAKARLILRHYLGLAQAPAVSRVFTLVLGVVVLAMAGLALAA